MNCLVDILLGNSQAKAVKDPIDPLLWTSCTLLEGSGSEPNDGMVKVVSAVVLSRLGLGSFGELELFGEPKHVVTMLLTPEKVLARAEAGKVLSEIRTRGFGSR